MKKPNPNTRQSKSTKKIAPAFTQRTEVKASPWLEDYLDLFTFKMKPITEAFTHRFAAELIEWSRQDDVLILKEFYLDRGIPRNTFYDWVNKYEVIKHAYNTAKERIGARREKGGMMRKFESSIISNSMPIYDADWKELLEWKAKMRNDTQDNTVKVVVIDKLTE